MLFCPTTLKGAYLIHPEKSEDERGFFSRLFCQEEFGAHALHFNLSQWSCSFNYKRGTLRGMHFQASPYEEIKIVYCTQGAIFDVIIDLRRESSTYKRWFGTELTALNRTLLYVPAGFAHGFQTLQDHSEVLYQISHPYHPGAARGILWNDPAFQISWPLWVEIISLKDQNYPLFVE